MKTKFRRHKGTPDEEPTAVLHYYGSGHDDVLGQVYQATTRTGLMVESDVAEVEITENYLGVRFVTNDGERLAVVHRDSGFELRYFPDRESDDWIDVDMKAGQIHHSNEVAEVGYQPDLRGLS